MINVKFSEFNLPVISVVIHARNTGSRAASLYRRVKTALAMRADWDHEVIMAGDSSTWRALSRIAQIDPKVVAVRVAAGATSNDALTAGVGVSGGAVVAVVDADADVALLPAMLAAIEGGADVAYAAPEDDMPATRLWRRIAGSRGGDFRMMTRDVVTRLGDAAAARGRAGAPFLARLLQHPIACAPAPVAGPGAALTALFQRLFGAPAAALFLVEDLFTLEELAPQRAAVALEAV